jgi:hypothetical protein
MWIDAITPSLSLATTFGTQTCEDVLSTFYENLTECDPTEHYIIRCAFPRRESGTAAPTAQHSPPRWASTLDLQAPPPPVQVGRGRRPLGAFCEVRAPRAR